jgi:hypothetical protein
MIVPEAIKPPHGHAYHSEFVLVDAANHARQANIF